MNSRAVKIKSILDFFRMFNGRPKLWITDVHKISYGRSSDYIWLAYGRPDVQTRTSSGRPMDIHVLSGKYTIMYF